MSSRVAPARVAAPASTSVRAVDEEGVTERLAFATDPRWWAFGVPLGVRPATAWVEVSPTRVTARFGVVRVHTSRANVVAAERTGPYAWWRTVGPPRLGLSDLSLTFATNGTAGVRLDFAEPVRGLGPLRHPSLTVTVADADRLVALLRG